MVATAAALKPQISGQNGKVGGRMGSGRISRPLPQDAFARAIDCRRCSKPSQPTLFRHSEASERSLASAGPTPAYPVKDMSIQGLTLDITSSRRRWPINARNARFLRDTPVRSRSIPDHPATPASRVTPHAPARGFGSPQVAARNDAAGGAAVGATTW